MALEYCVRPRDLLVRLCAILVDDGIVYKSWIKTNGGYHVRCSVQKMRQTLTEGETEQVRGVLDQQQL